MKISELIPRQGNVEVEGEVVEVGEVKTFSKFGRELRVADAVLKDDSGTIKMSLWNDDATRFKAGDKIRITNGYVNEFQGDNQLTAGKFGKIEKLGEGSDSGSDETGAEDSGEVSTETEQPEAEDSAEVSEETDSEDAESESGSEDIKEETI